VFISDPSDVTMAGRMMKFNLKDFREKLNVEPPAKAAPGITDVAIAKIGVKKMAFRGSLDVLNGRKIAILIIK